MWRLGWRKRSLPVHTSAYLSTCMCHKNTQCELTYWETVKALLEVKNSTTNLWSFGPQKKRNSISNSLTRIPLSFSNYTECKCYWSVSPKTRNVYGPVKTLAKHDNGKKIPKMEIEKVETWEKERKHVRVREGEGSETIWKCLTLAFQSERDT